MALTDTRIKALKPSDSTQKISDGGGLQLWVTPAGGKAWKLAYRFGGAQKTLTIGPYPVISLSDARSRRDDAKRQILDGIDPARLKQITKTKKAIGQTSTFAGLAAELVEKKRAEGKSDRTIEKIAYLLSLTTTISARPVAEVSAPEMLAMLKQIEGRGNHEAAKRTRGLCGEIFRFAIASGRATNDPTAALRGALIVRPPKHHAALTDKAAFAGLLRAIDCFTGYAATKAGLQLLALLAQRPGELRQALWPEFDLEAAIWTIPAARMKMRRAHRVPLPRQAVAILQGLQTFRRGGGPGFVLASTWTTASCISENTLNMALRRMGFTGDEMTSHGFRGAFSSLVNEAGQWHPDAIERHLAHVDKNSVRRVYARADFWDERVRLVQWWADECDAMKAAKP